ncbi:MAG: DNA polymerase II large subunit [Thermoplasmata archaeon]|nr:DNA polymerase II large subunit [Thermoplasmata archaeon]
MKPDEYFQMLKNEADKLYILAEKARSRGFDPEDNVEIPRAEDLASRVEQLIGFKGIAEIIRDFSKKYDRETVSIMTAKEIAKRLSDDKKKALDVSIRAGLAILTEGILVAPLEGISKIDIKKNSDGTDYLAIYYSGPIRGAGGTGQALSVLIGDVVRQDLGISRFKPSDNLVERYKEEIQIYKNVEHLQYNPSSKEIEITIRNCPVCIDGEGTIDDEVSGFRDLPEVETNRVRGGMCLVVAEGLIQKARKIKGIVDKMKIDGWNFIDDLIKDEKKDEEGKSSEKFIEDIVAGRPVFSHSERKGGFRLRYGRCRTGGLATVSINPATMVLMDNFIAAGTQLKLEFPGKAAGMTACETVEGPIVLLKNGDLVQANTLEEAIKIKDQVEKIYDNGEILIPFGEFLENNYPLRPGSFTIDWWEKIVKSKNLEKPREKDFETLYNFSLKYDVPLHPDYNLFWHDMDMEKIKILRDYLLKNSRISDGKLFIEKNKEIKEILCELGVLHIEREKYIVEKYSKALIRMLGLELQETIIIENKKFPENVTDPVEIVEKLSGITILPRAPTRVGARMGRPEKAAERKMKPPVNVLFPIGETSNNRRSITTLINDVNAKINVTMGLRVCPKCGRKTYKLRCEKCGSRTNFTEKEQEIELSIGKLWKEAIENLGEMPGDDFNVKGVKGLISKELLPEPLEKGILRALHNVWVYKDGTSRFDMSNLAITHFRIREIGLNAQKARELGYENDIFGNPVTNEDQICQIMPQDIIISKNGAGYLVNVSRFIDDLLEKFYHMEKFYNIKDERDLIGHLVMGLSPHTSGAVLARIIGFTDLSACFAHPFFHAAKRRNCDGDEDSVMLVLDALINFSRHYLPSSRGSLMDAPLFLSLKVDPREIDKEALNVDILWDYPLEFYIAAMKKQKPSDVSNIMETIKNRLGKENEITGYGFTNDTPDINRSVKESTYKTLKQMDEKTQAQLSLAKKLRAVDETDVANRIVSHHFIPDIMGNMRKYGTQEFRCTKCGRKYRRMPLSGKCQCGANLLLTTSEGNITKYLSLSKKVSDEFKINNYTRQRLLFAEEAIKTMFSNKEENKIIEIKENKNGKTLEDYI